LTARADVEVESASGSAEAVYFLRAKAMRKTVSLFFLSMLLLSGCFVRDPLFELASTSSSQSGLPRIIVFDPCDGLQGVPRNGLIAMLFSQSMDEPSVERNFSYSYRGRWYGASDGSFVWDANSRLAVFRPLAFFPYDAPLGTEVAVRMDDRGETLSGERLDRSYEWRFFTSDVTDQTGAQATAVQGSYPPGPQQPDTRIFVEFDKEVLRSTVEGSLLVISGDFQDVRTIENGRVEWTEPVSGTFRATYTTDDPFLAGKTYHFLLNNNSIIAVDWAGTPLYLGSLLPFQFQVTN
jgi:hypothetical protein